MNKVLSARLKQPIGVSMVINDLVDFNKDWVVASAIVESAKRRLITDLKQRMHEAIAELSIDDIEFKIN